MSKIGIVIPSRGLIFSKTAEEIIKAAKKVPHKFYFSHRKPIPECFESPVNRALLDWDNTHVLIVEDDMILPENIIKDALKLNKDVVVCDYPIKKDGRGAVLSDKTGKVIYSGTGFMLIKREVFDKLKAPYFRADIGWSVSRENERLKFTGSNRDGKQSYGMQDVTFCMKLHKANVDITLMKTVLGQRKLVSLGKTGTNNGAHNIEEWTKVVKDYSLKQYLTMPNALSSNSKLKTLLTPSGEILVTPEHAEKLLKNKDTKLVSDTETIIHYENVNI